MTAELVFGDDVIAAEAIEQRASLVAGGLDRLGIEDGDVVAVMLRNDPAYIEIMMGCRIAGCYHCPINWHFKAGEAQYILSDSGAKVLFLHEDLMPVIVDAVPESVTIVVGRPHPHVIQSYRVESVARAGADNHIDYEAWLARQTAYSGPPRAPRGHMAYTSGTTGRPKGVRRLVVSPESRPAQEILWLATIREVYGIGPGVRALCSAPLYHSAPSGFAQQVLLQGERFVLAPRFDAEETLKLIEQHQIQSVYLVPTMYVRLLRLPLETRTRYDLSSLRFVASTGSPCAPEFKRAMIDWFGPVIHETYASSETGFLTVIDAPTAIRKPGSAGKPLEGVCLKILDANGRLCQPGEVGTIYAKQTAVPDFTYNNNASARQAIERDGLITLGDMGYLDEEGYLYVCDRATDMVISGGVNIYPVEIEHVLINFPGISDCAVFGIPDDEFGEALVAAIIVDPEVKIAPDEITDYLTSRIADYKVPRRVDIVTSLPRDDNGKVAKHKLREPYWNGRARRI